MRISLPKFIFLLLSICTGLVFGLQAQVITAGPDSVEVTPLPSPKDTIPFYRVDMWSQPGKAALFSAVVPGLGQAYNKTYWKIPVLYVGYGVLGYFLYSNHKQYLHYRKGVQVRSDTITTNDVDRYSERLASVTNPEDQKNLLRRGRDQYRRWRDQNILFCIVGYTINVAEAYVYAHLKDFDISDDLSLHVQPDLIQTTSTRFSPALTLSLNLKK